MIRASTYSQFCAPTVLAHILGVDREEAAHYLIDTGHACPSGGTVGWDVVLEGFGCQEVPVDTLDAYRESKAQYDAKCQAILESWSRRSFPPDATMYPTVAAVRKELCRGRFVLTSGSHTLLIEDGEVTVDTMHTKSGRARVREIYRVA